MNIHAFTLIHNYKYVEEKLILKYCVQAHPYNIDYVYS